MACKKSELISAINSFAAARVSEDQNLLNFSAQLLFQLMETLEFSPEEEVTDETPEQPEAVAKETEEPKLKRPRKKVAA
tara:strand:+ start:2294 stop:2530 length:237 start_codon:yes stop_codon:yes gene_type:complete